LRKKCAPIASKARPTNRCNRFVTGFTLFSIVLTGGRSSAYPGNVSKLSCRLGKKIQKNGRTAPMPPFVECACERCPRQDYNRNENRVAHLTTLDSGRYQ
jgi:hypothetical protein